MVVQMVQSFVIVLVSFFLVMIIIPIIHVHHIITHRELIVNQKSYSNNNFPIENSNFNNRQVTDFRTNNLPTFNTREIRKNAESEYRSEYVPYSPEYYQPLRQKPRTIGRRLEVGKDYIFRNEEQKKSTPLLNLAEYHIPAALKKKLQLLDSDLVLDDDFEIPDISETNFNEKREDEEEEKVKENEENDENEEKEEKEEEEEEENEEKKKNLLFNLLLKILKLIMLWNLKKMKKMKNLKFVRNLKKLKNLKMLLN